MHHSPNVSTWNETLSPYVSSKGMWKIHITTASPFCNGYIVPKADEAEATVSVQVHNDVKVLQQTNILELKKTTSYRLPENT